MTNTTYKQTYDSLVTWEATDIKGIKAVPTLSAGLNSKDWIPELPFNWQVCVSGGNGQFSENNGKTLIELIKSKPDAKLFVEIGTASNFDGSSTETFILNKKDETTFVSIDVMKRTSENKGKPNVIYAVANSVDKNLVNFLNGEKIDILFIDGDHSVDVVFAEYKFYLPLMKDDGIIVLHDTTMHPGPFLLMEAIDESVFRKEMLHTDDLGLGIVYLQ